MASSISEWQERLQREGNVRFQQRRIRLLRMFGFCGLGLVVAILSLSSDGVSAWALGTLAFCGLGGGVFGYQLVTGRPNLTVTATGLSFNGGREVVYADVRELYTSLVAFGISYPPREGEVLRGPWQRRRGLKYSRIPARGVVDSFTFARWIAQLIGVDVDQLEGERHLGGSAWFWRIAQPDRP